MINRFLMRLSTPITLIRRSERREVRHMTLIFFLLLSLYAWTSPQEILLQDDGLFVSASFFNSTAHAPGYPLFCLLGKLFTLIPIGSIAYRVHLLSACFGAATCSMLYWIILKLFKQKRFAYTGALALGLSHLFWSQSITADVYTLNTFFVASLIALAFYINDHPKPWPTVAFTGVYGLGLSNHWPLLLLSTPGLALLVWPRRQLFIKHYVSLLPIFCLTLVPYMWMIMRSHQQPMISMYGPIASWQSFVSILFRKVYGPLFPFISSSLTTISNWFIFQLKALWYIFTPIGALLGILGYIRQQSLHRLKWHLASSYIFIANTFLLVLLVNKHFDHFSQLSYSVYPLTAYMILAIWIVGGLHYFQTKITPLLQFNQVRLLTISTCGGMLLALIWMNYPINNLRHYNWTKTYTSILLNGLKPNSTLVVHDDLTATTIAYYHLVQQYRPDIQVHHTKGLLFSHKTTSPLSHAKPNIAASLKTPTEQEVRPVYHSYRHPNQAYKSWAPLLYETKNPTDHYQSALSFSPSLLRDYDRFLNHKDRAHPWTHMVNNGVLFHYSQFLSVLLKQTEDQQLKTDIQQRFTQHNDRLYVLLGRLYAQVNFGDIETCEPLINFIQGHTQDFASTHDAATFHGLAGKYYMHRNNKRLAFFHLNKSLKFYPRVENSALLLLLKAYALYDQYEHFYDLKNRYFQSSPAPHTVTQFEHLLSPPKRE